MNTSTLIPVPKDPAHILISPDEKKEKQNHSGTSPQTDSILNRKTTILNQIDRHPMHHPELSTVETTKKMINPKAALVSYYASVALKNTSSYSSSPVNLAGVTSEAWIGGPGIQYIDYQQTKWFPTYTYYTGVIDIQVQIPNGCYVDIYIDPLTYSVRWHDTWDYIWRDNGHSFDWFSGQLSVWGTWSIVG